MITKTALITGASKGIGKELSKIHATNGDNLVLVARSEEQLRLLKNELETQCNSIKIEIIVKDLTVINSAKEIYDELKVKNIQIDYLINNAGFGDFGLFINTPWSRYQQMIDLNITSLSHMCHLFLSDMVLRKHGKVMNVSSTAAFQPEPMMAVYFATKSYVLHFSEALNNEVNDNGVSVTAFCPGPTDTHFMEDSNMKKSKLIKNTRLPSAYKVALSGYNAMMTGRSVKVFGFINKVVAYSVCIFPRKWVVSITRKMQ